MNYAIMCLSISFLCHSPLPTPTQQLLTYINDYRETKGLGDVTESTSTCDFAKIRVKEIQTDWSHNGFDQHVLINEDVPDGIWSENLAKNFTNLELVLQAWQHSPTHNEILLQKELTYMCIKRDGVYWALEGTNK